MLDIVVLVIFTELADGHVLEHAMALRPASDLPADILSTTSAAECLDALPSAGPFAVNRLQPVIVAGEPCERRGACEKRRLDDNLRDIRSVRTPTGVGRDSRG